MSDSISVLSTGIDVNVVSESDTSIYLITAGQQGANASINDLGTPSNRFVLIGNGTAFDSRLLVPADLPTAIDAANLADGSVSNTEFLNLNGTTSNIQTQLDSKASISFASNASNLTSGTLSVSRLPSNIPASNIADGTVDNAEFQTLNGVTSSIQAQLDGKSPVGHPHDAADITSGTVSTARLGSGAPTSSTLLDGSGTWRSLAAGDIPAHNHSGVDITSGTVDAARLGAGVPTSSKFLDGSSNWRALLNSDLPAGLSAGVGYGQSDPSAFALGLYGYGTAGDSTQPGITCGGTAGAGSVIYNCPTAKTHNLLINGTLNLCVGSALGSIADGNWVIGKYGNPSAVGSVTGVCGSGTSVYYNAPSGHSIRINNTVVGLIQSSLITFSAPITIGNSYTVTAGSNQIVGTANGPQINAPTGSAIILSTNGTTRGTIGLNGLVFASNATAVSSTNISIGSGAANTLSLNAPSGGSVATLVAGTSKLTVTATAATLTVPIVTPTSTPASATATGVAGQWAWDANYIYICTATNTWRRVAHSTW